MEEYIGIWKILRKYTIRRKNGKTQIRCVTKCPLCNKLIDRPKDSLIKNDSCFCIHSKNTGEITGTKWNIIKFSAKRREIEFNITPEYAWEIYQRQNGKCALSGITLIFAKNKKEVIAGIENASLDRIDSTKGYIEGNIQWLDKNVNYMKYNLSQQDFINICKLVLDFQNSKKERIS